jgi:aminopeptidase N
MRRGLALFAFVAITLEANAVPTRQVLPDDVVPTHYDLSLVPDATALTFTGKVAITVDVAKSTDDVVLNAVGLKLEHVQLENGATAVVSLEEPLGRAKLHFPAPLQPGKHVVTIDYDAKILRETLGFFAMDYASATGTKRTLATNFEPAHARKLLPCWDEPGRKATFTVTVDIAKDDVAVSNMPVAETKPLSAALKRVRFAESPRMSTYLLFVGIGDFERIHQAVDGVDVGVVVKRGDTARATYALEQAVGLLHYYNEYFGIRYPLPKLDLVAAPGVIQGGAMENWGAIFYSQSTLLFDPTRSTEADRQRVFLVVSHEMAHQWFGDLVTMAWWDNLWLNEGFARWMQTYAADQLHPEWQTGLQAMRIFEEGKGADSVPSTHPVVQEVLTAEQADQAFDNITYDKGAAVINMLSAYVGHDKFRDGVRQYMHEHAYGNTVDSDLWSIMQKVVGKPILAIEKDFTSQVGVPLVRVTSSASGVQLTTGRFVDDPDTLEGQVPQKWRLPLDVATVGSGAPRSLLLEGESTVSGAAPLLVNAGQNGYARVLYDGSFDSLAAQMGKLGAFDQLGLLNDAYNLGISRYARTDRLMTLFAALPADANPVVWNRVVALLVALDHRYAASPERAAYRGFAAKLLAPVLAHIGTAPVQGESSNAAVLRESMLEAQADFGDTNVVARARKMRAGHSGTSAEQRAALSIVGSGADAATFDELLAEARNTADPLEKEHLFVALAGVGDDALARRMVDVALSTDVTPGANSMLLDSLAVKHPDMVWQAVAPKLDSPQLPLDKTERWSLAGSIAGSSANLERIADVEAYAAHSVPAEARRPLVSAEARIRRNHRIQSEVLPELNAWLNAHP